MELSLFRFVWVIPPLAVLIVASIAVVRIAYACVLLGANALDTLWPLKSAQAATPGTRKPSEETGHTGPSA